MQPSRRFVVGVADTIGRRSGMEDAHAVLGCLGGVATHDAFMLFDGHNGPAAARTANARLPRLLAAALARGTAPDVALRVCAHTCLRLVFPFDTDRPAPHAPTGVVPRGARGAAGRARARRVHGDGAAVRRRRGLRRARRRHARGARARRPPRAAHGGPPPRGPRRGAGGARARRLRARVQRRRRAARERHHRGHARARRPRARCRALVRPRRRARAAPARARRHAPPRLRRPLGLRAVCLPFPFPLSPFSCFLGSFTLGVGVHAETTSWQPWCGAAWGPWRRPWHCATPRTAAAAPTTSP